MRIIWSSNAPWVPSGYGVQTKLTLPALKQLGHDVACIAWCGLEAGRIHVDGVPFYPKGGAPYGTDVLVPHAMDFKADIAITLIDAWVYDASQYPPEVRWVPYFPIDSEPVSPKVVKAVGHQNTYERIVMSKFGKAEMDRVGLSSIYIPHMVDTHTFCPKDKAEACRMLNMDASKFTVGMIAANKGFPDRKSWGVMLEAWCRLRANHDDVAMYLHTMPCPDANGGFDIGAHMNHLVPKYGLKPTTEITMIAPYMMWLGLPDNYMVNAFNAIDVLCNVAMGEGFGVPIVEAQACGTPVITGDWTAMSELTFSGWKVAREEAQAFWITSYDTYQYRPNVEAVHDRMEQAYSWWKSGETQELKDKARAGALDYDTALVTEKHWKPAMQELEGRIRRGCGELKLVEF